MRASPIAVRVSGLYPPINIHLDGWQLIGGTDYAWQWRHLRVIATVDGDWEHVSVSCQNRTPTWEEMEWVKRCFFLPTETCMQLHVPEAEHVNCHPYCLHIWRNKIVPVYRPPNYMVGGLQL